MASSIPRTMKALQLVRSSASAPPSLTLAELPVPKAGPGQVLVKIHASAIQPSDRINAKGGFGALTTYPRIPGRDFSGVIVDGPAHRIGQPVFGTSGSTHAFTQDGYQAEYAVLPEQGAADKPANLSFEQAAVSGVPFSTADLMLNTAHAQKGETALILGANGAVGRAIQVLCAARGLTVLKGVRGASGDVDTEADPELKAAKDKTGGKGPNIVLDTVGQTALTAAAVEALAFGGRLVTIAAPRSGSTMISVDLLSLYRQNKSVLGINSVSVGIEAQGARLRSIEDALNSELFQTLDERWEAVPLKHAVAAYENPAARTKYVVVMEE